MQVVAQAFQIGQDLPLPGGVERGKRFVHQQKPWPRKDRARQRDAAFLAPREGARLALKQGADAQKIDDQVPVTLGPACPPEPRAIGQVLRHGHMREQSRILKDITDPAPVRRHIDPLRGVI